MVESGTASTRAEALDACLLTNIDDSDCFYDSYQTCDKAYYVEYTGTAWTYTVYACCEEAPSSSSTSMSSSSSSSTESSSSSAAEMLAYVVWSEIGYDAISGTGDGCTGEVIGTWTRYNESADFGGDFSCLDGRCCLNNTFGSVHYPGQRTIIGTYATEAEVLAAYPDAEKSGYTCADCDVVA
jgi:hypothetical protein